MKSFFLGVTMTLALTVALIGVFRVQASTVWEALLPTIVVAVQQDVPVRAQVHVPLANGEMVTATIPLTITVDLKIGLSSPLSITVDGQMVANDPTKTDAKADDIQRQPVEVDQSDPEQVAAAILVAYQNQDLAGLATFTTGGNREFVEELMALDPDDPDLEELYSGWRWEAVRDWDGELREIRYFTRDEKIIAEVYFADMGDSEIATVALFPEDGRWYFEDIHSPSPASFANGDEEQP